MKKLQLKDAGKFVAMLMCALFISFSLSSCHDDDDAPSPSEILKAWEFNVEKSHAAGMPSSWEGFITDLSHEGFAYQWAKVDGKWQLNTVMAASIHFNSDGTSGTMALNEYVEDLLTVSPLKRAALSMEYEFRKFNGKSIEIKISDVWVPAKVSKEKLPEPDVK